MAEGNGKQSGVNVRKVTCPNNSNIEMMETKIVQFEQSLLVALDAHLNEFGHIQKQFKTVNKKLDKIISTLADE